MFRLSYSAIYVSRRLIWLDRAAEEKKEEKWRRVLTRWCMEEEEEEDGRDPSPPSPYLLSAPTAVATHYTITLTLDTGI